MLVYVAIVIEMFCVYHELDMDMNIDVVIYCVELVAFVFKFIVLSQ